MLNLFILFILLFSVWIIISGLFNAVFITIGVVSCFVAVCIYRMIYQDSIKGMPVIALRMLVYGIWLVKEIAKSSLHVSLKMWKLEPEISPQTEWIRSNLKNDLAITVFANSVTLTPGTVTIGIEEGMLHVHSLNSLYMKEIKSGSMLRRVDRIT